jgi:hypothetical protein
MLQIRSIGLLLVALAVASALTASVASASAPEFNPGTLNTFTALRGVSLLETSSTSPITCTSGTTTGEITGVKTVGSVKVTFSGCTSSEGEGCSVTGGAAGTGKILTNALTGELGSVKTSEAESGAGLLLSPASGTTFATLEGSCLLVSPSPVEGTIAAEVLATTEEGKTGELSYLGSKGKQSIKEINVLGTVKKPELRALGLLSASLQAPELMTFASSVKVRELTGDRITVNPTSKIFMNRTVALNQSENVTLTYTNHGPGGWTVHNLYILPQVGPGAFGFSLRAVNNTCANQSFAEGGTCSLELEFHPPVVGTFFGAFKIFPYAPFTSLEGKGV